MVGNRRIRFVIVLDSCCISIGLVFIKDSPVSSFWVLRFRDLGVFVFEFWVLRFRDLGASCFGLRFRNYPFRPAGRVLTFDRHQVCSAINRVTIYAST